MSLATHDNGRPVFSNIRLTYFNSRARAELSRSILAVVGVLYEDIRVPYTEWRAIKESMQFSILVYPDAMNQLLKKA